MMEENYILSILLTLPLFLMHHVNVQAQIFNITNYGATPQSDIGQALSNAWKDAKSSKKASKIVIPMGTWKLNQVLLEGPNSAPLELEIKGTIKANPNVNLTLNKQTPWITINNVNFLTLSGGGVLDGQGQQAWLTNDCNTNQTCTRFPFNLSLNFTRNAIVRDLTSKDSKFFHINCELCANVSFTRLTISADGESPNTDGIHVIRSQMINVTDSMIGTGDDCISLKNNLTQVFVHNISCGPGHGISVGSLGKNSNEKNVSTIFVGNCTFINTTNGVRIKTYPSSPAPLQVSDLYFQDLVMENALNPIIIDQDYCPSGLCDQSTPSLVQVRNVTFNNVRGTTSSRYAVTLNCSSIKPCMDVVIGNVNLSYIGRSRGQISTTCANIQPTFYGTQIPPICAM